MTTSASTPVLATRHATLADLAGLLRDQQARKLDVVAPATALRSAGARRVIDQTDPQLTPDGVTMTTGTYTPTEVCDDGIAEKLGIPAAYLRRLRDEHPALYDANVNGWLARADKSYLVRCLRGDRGGGIARAFLSSSFKMIDNLDVLMAALDGLRQSGVPTEIDGCDLTPRRMYVRVVSPAIRAVAPQLLAGYRSPFTGQSGADNPVVFAGWVLSNSETGCGAFTIIPRLVVQICRNGMTMSKDALRAVHLGGRLEDGVIRWSHETQQRNLELITAQARDAVVTFLDTDYVEKKIAEMSGAAGQPVTDPQQAIEIVAQRLRFTDEQQKSILNHFIRGGDLSAGGVMHAVTSTAQTLPDADTAHEMEAQALPAFEFAAQL
jgi:uncharacterized protein YoaH (UPF0181 family)